jgi:catalase
MSHPQGPGDRGIPLLTEVLAPAPAEPPPVESAEPVFSEDVAAAWPDPRQPRPPATEQWPAATASASDDDDDAHWRQLSQDIQEQVLQQLLGQVNILLKQQVAEQMAVAFEHITQQLTAQIQVNLEQALQQSVLLAVEQEIEKTRMTKNKGF